MPGHANERDLIRLKELQHLVSSGVASPIEAIELALLYWEPCHMESDAIGILQAVANPQNSLAIIWLAYLYVYHQAVYQVDLTPLQEAVRILSQIDGTDSEHGAAARVVLYGALHGLDRSVDSSAEKIRVLEESVGLRPSWVYNRYFLAVEYAKTGRYAEALGEVREARRNVLGASDGMHPVTRRFEISITGRLSNRILERSLQPLEDRLTARAGRL